MTIIVTLRELHRILRQLADLRGRLAQGPRIVAAGEANVARREEELRVAKEGSMRTRVLCNEKEVQLKQREGHIADTQRRLNACSSNREYQALVEQIAADEQANSVLSDEILEMLDKITAEKEKVIEIEGLLVQARQDLDKQRERVASERQSLEQEVARLSAELSSTERDVPAESRADYDRAVKGRGEEALAALEGDCCGGCYQRVTPQSINELKLGRVVFCKSCGRILYLLEDTRPFGG